MVCAFCSLSLCVIVSLCNQFVLLAYQSTKRIYTANFEFFHRANFFYRANRSRCNWLLAWKCTVQRANKTKKIFIQIEAIMDQEEMCNSLLDWFKVFYAENCSIRNQHNKLYLDDFTDGVALALALRTLVPEYFTGNFTNNLITTKLFDTA